MPDFKPYGATEVRRAAQAFITMRERIERHVSSAPRCWRASATI